MMGASKRMLLLVMGLYFNQTIFCNYVLLLLLYLCKELAKTLPALGKWPCLFTASEEFFTDKEVLDMKILGLLKTKLYLMKILNQIYRGQKNFLQ
jgi:hypothetical protein